MISNELFSIRALNNFAFKVKNKTKHNKNYVYSTLPMLCEKHTLRLTTIINATLKYNYFICIGNTASCLPPSKVIV